MEEVKLAEANPQEVEPASQVNEAEISLEKQTDLKPKSEKIEVKPQDKQLQVTKAAIDILLGKSPKLIGKVKSYFDKLDDITVSENGSVAHNLLKCNQPHRKN